MRDVDLLRSLAVHLRRVVLSTRWLHHQTGRCLLSLHIFACDLLCTFQTPTAGRVFARFAYYMHCLGT